MTTAEMHEISVTPFIDVMLVLLIIFMGGCAAAGDGGRQGESARFCQYAGASGKTGLSVGESG